MIGIDFPFLCETGYTMKVNNISFCMNPPVSITSTSDGFLPGDECFYKAYLNYNNVNNESIQFGTAKCGFNKGHLAYCDQ